MYNGLCIAWTSILKNNDEIKYVLNPYFPSTSQDMPHVPKVLDTYELCVEELERLWAELLSKTQLSKETETKEEWISVDERTPIAFETGHWDGKRSDFVVVENKNGEKFIARVYEGTMDGSKFLDWYDNDDFEITDVVRWLEIPL